MRTVTLRVAISVGTGAAGVVVRSIGEGFHPRATRPALPVILNLLLSR
jgi:hypothetical protein